MKHRDKDKDKPQFSRNLEVDTSPVERRAPARPTGEGEAFPALSAEEKRLYFQVEGEKILQVLALELERPEPDPASVLLLKDLHRSWRTLWRGDDSFPVGPFGEMFDQAFSILSSIALLGRKIALEERVLLDELQQDMTRLASGEASIACLETCRRLIDRVAPLADKLKEESMGWSGKALRAPEEKPGGTERGRQDSGAPEPRADITSSVDEWFDQVTRLMVQPLPTGGEDTRRGGAAGSRSGAAGPRAEAPAARSAARKAEEPPARTSQIGLFAGEKSAAPPAKKSPVAPAAVSKPEEDKPLAQAVPPAAEPEQPLEPAATLSPRPPQEVAPPVVASEIPVEEPSLAKEPVAERTEPVQPESSEEPATADELLPEPQATPEVISRPAAVSRSTEPVEPPQEVLNYFRELSAITLDVLRHNLAGPSGAAGRREVRLAATYLDDLLGAARDFGLEGRVPSSEGLRASLDQAASASSPSGRAADRLARQAAEFAEQLSLSLN